MLSHLEAAGSAMLSCILLTGSTYQNYEFILHSKLSAFQFYAVSFLRVRSTLQVLFSCRFAQINDLQEQVSSYVNLSVNIQPGLMKLPFFGGRGLVLRRKLYQTLQLLNSCTIKQQTSNIQAVRYLPCFCARQFINLILLL